MTDSNWQVNWNSGYDVGFICGVTSDTTQVTAIAYARDEDGRELLDSTPFDDERVWVFYRVKTNGAYTYYSASMTRVSSYTYQFLWPTGLTGSIEFVIRARRSVCPMLPNPDGYYNFSFYPPLVQRPEAWPDLPGVDPNAYDWEPVGSDP